MCYCQLLYRTWNGEINTSIQQMPDKRQGSLLSSAIGKTHSRLTGGPGRPGEPLSPGSPGGPFGANPPDRPGGPRSPGCPLKPNPVSPPSHAQSPPSPGKMMDQSGHCNGPGFMLTTVHSPRHDLSFQVENQSNLDVEMGAYFHFLYAKRSSHLARRPPRAGEWMQTPVVC